MSTKAMFEGLARAIGLYFAITGLITLAAILIQPDVLVAESLLAPGLSLLIGAVLLFKGGVVTERVFGSRDDA